MVLKPWNHRMVCREESDAASIKYCYPVTGKPNIDQDTRRLVENKLAAFKKLPPAPADLPVKYINTLDISYEQAFKGNGYLSLVFYALTYTGGAHPSTTVHCRNYDLRRDRRVTLADFCRTDQAGRRTLRELLFNKLMATLERPDEIWIRDGISQTDLENFTLDQEALTFYFGQYQVAPYAVGIPKARLTFSELNNIRSIDRNIPSKGVVGYE